MKKRETPVEQFSTFLQFQEHNSNLVSYWEPDSVLEQNMSLKVQSDPDAGANFWAQYFLKQARKDNPLAKRHLSAYLEETCYWTAWKTYQQMPTSYLTFHDYFQIAREVASNPVALFQKYDSAKGSLKSYAQMRLKDAIRAVIYKGQEKDKYSDWGLLKSGLSKEFLTKALQKKVGVNEPQLSRCLLAWQGFKEVGALSALKGSRQLPPPTDKQLATIAEYYNECRFPASSEPAVTGSDIQELLDICIQAARASVRIQVNSLDAEGAVSPSAIAHDPEEQVELEHSQAKTEAEWQEISSVLKEAIASLPDSAQKMLTLEYGLPRFNQTEIGNMFGIRQDKVSKKLKKYRRFLVETLAKWSQTRGTPLNHKIINELSKLLKEWLSHYYQSAVFEELLKTTLVQQFPDEISLLKHHFGRELPLNTVANELHISETAVNEKLEQVKQRLQQELNNWMKSTLELPPDSLNAAAKPVSTLVDNFLNNAPYGAFEMERRK